MVDERELREAIAECESAPASLQSMQKLAVFNAVYDRYFTSDPESTEVKPRERERVPTVTDSDSEFVRLVSNMDWAALLDILDELMETVKILQPRLYEAVMRKLRE